MEVAHIGRIAASVLATATVVLINRLARPALQRAHITPRQALRLRRSVRFSLGLLLLAFLIVVWAEELRSAALVISAFAVAIAVTCKELNANVLGWWMKHASRSYRTGDRIEIGGFRGEVADYGLFTTTLAEVQGDFRTGRVIVVPNNMLLTHAVRNETFASAFTWQEMEIPVAPGEDWREAEAHLLESARAETAAFSSELERQLEEAQERFALRPFHPEPRVVLSLLGDGKVRLTLRVPLPLPSACDVKERILRGFLDRHTREAAPRRLAPAKRLVAG